MEQPSKTEIRSELRRRLADLSPEDRNARSRAVSTRVAATPEWAKASVVMLYLATPQEVDTSELALQAWQAGKTVVVPKVSWNQRRILPTEINSLGTEMTTSGQGIREPARQSPVEGGEPLGQGGGRFSAAECRNDHGFGPNLIDPAAFELDSHGLQTASPLDSAAPSIPSRCPGVDSRHRVASPDRTIDRDRETVRARSRLVVGATGLHHHRHPIPDRPESTFSNRSTSISIELIPTESIRIETGEWARGGTP